MMGCMMGLKGTMHCDGLRPLHDGINVCNNLLKKRNQHVLFNLNFSQRLGTRRAFAQIKCCKNEKNIITIYKDNSNMNNDLYQTKGLIQEIIKDELVVQNPNLQNALDVLKKNPGILKYQTVDGQNQVIVHSTVGKLFQGSNKPKICQETQEVKNLLNAYYAENNVNVQIIPSDNVNNLCPPSSGGSKSRRRKTHNKRASKSKSKTQRRRRARARMSHK